MERPTPYAVVFAGQVERHFPDVQQEARSSQKDTSDLAQFVSVPSVQRILGEIESPEVLADAPAAAAEYATLLHVAYRFWESGKVVHTLDRDSIEAAITPTGEPVRDGAVRTGPCYLQLPERWMWAQIGADSPHEPVDGLFVTQSADGRQLTVLAVLGFRPARSGFSQVSITAAPEELPAAARALRSPPFAPLMDGGVEARFRSIASPGELLQLACLALSCVAQ